MKRAEIVLKKLLHPHIGIIIILPLIAFAGLIYIFATGNTEGAAAYVFYVLSAYSLVILVTAVIKTVPSAIAKARLKVRKKAETNKFLNQYLTDRQFKENVNLYQGAVIDAFYTVFRLITGAVYSSVWFIALAVYHLLLGLLRIYLIVCKRKEAKCVDKLLFEYRCYRKTALCLFLLNIQMSAVIVLMVWTNSAFAYPGYIIYISAIYTFYKAISSVIALVKFRKSGSPILSSAKTVNCIAAMMSVLGLQTAMIAEFSVDNEKFRFTMNTVTGTVITVLVIAAAIIMLVRVKRQISEYNSRMDVEHEQVGE